MFLITRRSFMAATTAAAALSALSACGDSAEAMKAETKKLNEWLEERFKFWVGRSPLGKAYLGIKEDMGKWDDLSETHQKEDYELQQKELADLKAKFKLEKLSADGALSFRLYEVRLNQDISDYKWRNHDYPINQMFGWQAEIPSFLINIHRVGTKDEAVAYIERMNGIPVVVDQIIDGLKTREALGVMPPKFVFSRVLRDSRNVLTGKPFGGDKATADKDSALMEDIRGKIASLQIPDEEKTALTADAEKALLTAVKPAYEKLIATLEDQETRATTDDGVWKLPEGEAYYQHMLQQHTTTKMTAQEIHEFGLKEVTRIHGEIQEIMKKVNFDGDMKAFFKFMNDDPQFYYPSTPEGKAAYIAKAKSVLADMTARLDDVFLTKPKAALEVKPVEPFREESASGAFYQPPGAFDGRPGTYYINTFDMKAISTFELEALAYHEGIPGHHMQIAIAQELQDVPSFRKFGSDFTAYSEGWGLYCERLPKEMGFYKDPYSDFGRLTMELWRSCRLVVDTGLHAPQYKWTREDVIKYLSDNTPNTEFDIRNETERYIVMPGQATAYKIGMEKILSLREDAKKKLGDKFDIREYHDVVLKSGPVPLSIMEERVDAWVKSKKA
ncbi:MAG: DUF885 domain-containing protein [Rhodospirillaceae bacterium]|nr:DUF885 domain-containing protein [Rhodospirillaceae bacterium]